MAKNPMQKRARNSFLLGILVALLISAVIIGLLVMQLVKLKKEEQEQLANIKKVVVLKNDVGSGESINSGMLEIVEVDSSVAPLNVINLSDILENTIAKITLKKGTIISHEMLTTDNLKTEAGTVPNDLRLQEYNMIALPSTLEVGDYIDIRLVLPSGQDYIVIAKKRVVKTSDTSDSTIWLEMTESEILTMSNAIIEAYIMKGSSLYATTYTEAGMQQAATATYPVSASVIELIRANPNILTNAKNELTNRYNSLVNERTNGINAALSQYEMQRINNIETKLKEQIQKQQEERQRYLNLLNK